MQRITLTELSSSSEVLIDRVDFAAPGCLVYTNFLSLNEEFGRHHLRDIYVAKQQRLPEIRLHHLPAGINLAVCQDEDFIPYVADRALAEQILTHWSEDQLTSAIAAAHGGIEISDEALLVARFGLRTWGHWLVELLPKVVVAERAYPGRFRYVVPESIFIDLNLRTIRQSLAAYGIGPERLVLVRGGRSYRFANLFAVSPIWQLLCGLHPEVAGLMRQIIPEPEPSSTPSANLALLRRETTTRNIENIAELCAHLELRGWQVFDIAYLDFLDQVRALATAKNVISVLGSGLTGLLYSPPEVNVLTLAPHNWSDVFFLSLMQERNARLADVRGISVGSTFAEAYAQPFTVALVDLDAGLRALGAPADPVAPDPAAASAAKRVTLHDALVEAHRFQSAGRLAEAEQRIREAIEDAPDEVMLYLLLIGLCMQQGKTGPAIAAAEAGLGVYPAAIILRAMQEHLTGSGQYVAAIHYARREAAIDPAEAEPFSLLGHSLCRVGEFDEAASYFARAAALRGDDFGLWLAQTRALTAAGRVDEAVAALRDTIALFPMEAEGYLLLGHLLVQRGEREPAINAFRETLRLKPDHPDALAAMANLSVSPTRDGSVPPPATSAPLGQTAENNRMHYHEYLRLMHQILEPEAYLEVGVDEGESFALARGFAIGIDPNFRVDKPMAIGKTVMKLFRCTSDEFFAQYDAGHELSGRHLGLVFIDGLHLLEFALRDFMNIEQYSDGNTVVLFHDTLPYAPEIADREPVPGDPAWTGDVWKIVEILERYRPELYLRHVNVAPTGLLVVTNLSATNKVLPQNYDNIVAEYTEQKLSPERLDNLRKPALLREPVQMLECVEFGALVGRVRIAQAIRRAAF